MEVDFPRGGVKGKPVHTTAAKNDSEPQKRKPMKHDKNAPKVCCIYLC